jgi:bifunctional NMN adenylyltransferase/nudix hydrolase
VEYDLGVFIGRFQPLHSGHLACIEAALQRCRYLLIIIGSANQPRRWDVLPFNVDERMQMIEDAAFGADPKITFRLLIQDIPDSDYSNEDWVSSVQACVGEVVCSIERESSRLEPCGDPAKVALVGHSKDQSSYYIKMFPQWDTIEVPSHKQLDGTAIRERLYETKGDPAEIACMVLEGSVPHGVGQFLHNFVKTDDFKELLAERAFMLDYLSGWDRAPYPPNFVTSDAVVIQQGHVLLVERKGYPGKGLRALPGGHVEKDATFFETVLKELNEETRLKVPLPILKRSLKYQEVFDSPTRSTRKRTITTAFLFHLVPEIAPQKPDETAAQFRRRIREIVALPKVRAGSDAKRAVWHPLSDLDRSRMFEDHYKIIKRFEKRLKEDV